MEKPFTGHVGVACCESSSRVWLLTICWSWEKRRKTFSFTISFLHKADGQQCCSKLRQMYENSKAVKHKQKLWTLQVVSSWCVEKQESDATLPPTMLFIEGPTGFLPLWKLRILALDGSLEWKTSTGMVGGLPKISRNDFAKHYNVLFPGCFDCFWLFSLFCLFVFIFWIN